jgi:cell division protein FtsZ
VRSGATRAVEAAQAAMASPLLESGAIDGARGILINITGSSNLKLNEVNEASTLIQSAAHEDANIIFGAVLNESMGDDVKITVIATGFKQQGSPERRDVLLSSARPEKARMEGRPPAPRFASEDDDEPASNVPAPAVFVPVTAREVISVFTEARTEVEPLRLEPCAVKEREPEPPVTVAIAEENVEAERAAAPPALYEEQPDELDIPAFMRKGGL